MTHLVPTISKNIGHFWPKSHVLTKSCAENTLQNFSLVNFDILLIAPSISAELAVNGLLVGAIFALIAYGMALVWGVMNIINVAQGAYVILGGYVSLFFCTWLSALAPEAPVLLWVVLSLPISATAVAFVSWVAFLIVVRRILDKDLFVSLLATFGIELVLQQAMNQFFTAEERIIDANFPTWNFLSLYLPGSRLLGAALGLSAAAGIVLLMRRSGFGRAIRATAQNPRAARIMGVNTNRVYAATYALNGAICGIAGVIVAFVFILHPFQGLIYTLRSFAIVIVAGICNIPGVVFAGPGIGVYENFGSFLAGSELQNALVFLLVPVILLFRMHLLRRQRRFLS